jgi:catechol 2,3-dioxygenase-like lactoylglutathione lyase family enzyme
MTIEIDHTSLSVSDYEKAKQFYTAALAPLGVSVQMEFPMGETGGSSVAGLGTPGKPFLWIASGGKTSPHIHIALRTESRAQVDAFYAAAIAAGATDNGPPGLRPHYHETYYAAFVFDPDGHNIEAVTHTPDMPAKAAPARNPAKKAAAKPAKKAEKPAKRAAAKPARKVAKPTRKAAKKPAAKKAAAKTSARRKPAGRKTSRRKMGR